MAWAAQANIPWALVGGLYFSPIIDTEVYIVDNGQNFYRFNIGTQQYTALANVPFSGLNCYRALRYRNGLLYCINEGGGAEPIGRRISWYNPTTNVWASSSQVPFGVSFFLNIKSFCFIDDDTIWAWVKRNGFIRFKCVRYVISTDTWTEFANDTGVIANGVAQSAIMNAAGTQVFGVHMGLSSTRYGIYTIATDAYTYSPVIGSIVWTQVGDPLRFWFTEPAGGAPDTLTYGYLENDGVTEVHDYWAANAARAAGWYGSLGVSGLHAIIDQASGVNPMTYFDGAIIPTVQTLPATEIT